MLETLEDEVAFMRSCADVAPWRVLKNTSVVMAALGIFIDDIAGYNFTEKGNPSKPLLKESKAFDS